MEQSSMSKYYSAKGWLVKALGVLDQHRDIDWMTCRPASHDVCRTDIASLPACRLFHHRTARQVLLEGKKERWWLLIDACHWKVMVLRRCYSGTVTSSI